MGRRDETETFGTCADVRSARGPAGNRDGEHGPMTRAIAGLEAAGGYDAQVQRLTPARAAPPAFERTGPWMPPAMWFDGAPDGAGSAPVQRSEGPPRTAPPQWPQPALDAREMCPVDTELDPGWRLELARECVNRVGRERLEMLEARPGAVDARTLDRLRDTAHERLRAIEHAFWVRGGGEEGPDAGAVTHLLATAVGPNTLGPHLRPRARQQVSGALAGRLAAATAALAGAEMLNRKYLRGVLSGLISDLCADVRGVSGSEAEPPAGEAMAVARAEAEEEAPEAKGEEGPEAPPDDHGDRRESLLTHLRDHENTAHAIDGALAQALDGAKADRAYFALHAPTMVFEAQPWGRTVPSRPCDLCGRRSAAHLFLPLYERPSAPLLADQDWFHAPILGPTEPLITIRVADWMRGEGKDWVGKPRDGKPPYFIRRSWDPDDRLLASLPERFREASLEPVEPLRPDEYPLPWPPPRSRGGRSGKAAGKR